MAVSLRTLAANRSRFEAYQDQNTTMPLMMAYDLLQFITMARTELIDAYNLDEAMVLGWIDNLHTGIERASEPINPDAPAREKIIPDDAPDPPIPFKAKPELQGEPSYLEWIFGRYQEMGGAIGGYIVFPPRGEGITFVTYNEAVNAFDQITARGRSCVVMPTQSGFITILKDKENT